jgi:signal transduction histidine kinase
MSFGSFERRLLVALALFSLVPSFALLGAGTYLLFQAVELHTAPETWESVRASGLDLLDRAERSRDPAMARAAARHRAVLTASLQQSRRWAFLNQRVLELIPAVALVLAALLVWLAVRSARGIARELSRPIRELVEWAGRVARQEPLPAAAPEGRETGEFAVLRDAFRAMAVELDASRGRALEEERNRSWITMARGVAHELKNSLTPLRLAVRALERQTPEGSPAREPVEVVAAESTRLEELARNFAQFGHLPEGPVSEIDLAEQLEYLLRTHLPPGIEHRLRAPVELPRIHGHHDALSRAFANLLLNAADAMADTGGMVTVKLTAIEAGVEVRVLDSGPGIPPELLERIWEPDFTTKARGTGLGLALVRRTLQAHGGGVWAHNRPEGGAEFRVVLPIG